jgi:hypothetical protein
MTLVNLGSEKSLNNKKIRQITKTNLNEKKYYEKNYVNRIKIEELLRSSRSK